MVDSPAPARHDIRMATLAYRLSGTLHAPSSPLPCRGIAFGADDVLSCATLTLPMPLREARGLVGRLLEFEDDRGVTFYLRPCGAVRHARRTHLFAVIVGEPAGPLCLLDAAEIEAAT